jgi:hypothetical protein
MDTKKKEKKRSIVDALYDLSTPTLDKYYRAMRKQLRFPRYYKKALNW